MIRRLLSPRVALATTLALGAARVADAQCPDGSPPPCRAAAPATVTAPKRVNPPLDERAWIVVPFDNLAKRPEVDWLRTASVNLLYLDMSRWRDIRVIDDERVADLVRETPEAKDAQTLSLGAGLAVAKRAGAGKLVMGDVLQLGSRTTVTAKVFDVKTGQRLRSVREETTVQDSVMPMFGRLARKVLNLAPPRGANVGALGTSSVSAYQAYVEGVNALNNYDLATAHQHFEEALKYDSTFALAHFKLSVVIGWENPADPSRKAHAEAANRLSGSLPPRERTLIAGMHQQANTEWTRSCETYASLVRTDSSDVEAWYGLADCLYHDPSLEAIGGDSTRLRFRADWVKSIRAFERVLQLDPTYHLAYQHIIDALTSERHFNTCMPVGGRQRCYASFLIRDADSMIVNAVDMVADSAKLRAQAEQYIQTRSRRRNLDLANAFASAWVQASPDEPQAHRALARVLVLQGRSTDAALELEKVRTKGTLQEELRGALERMEINYKLGRGADAIKAYDNARSSGIALPGSPMQFGNAISGYGPAFGRIVEFDSVLTTGMRAANAPEFVQRYQRAAIRTVLTGQASDSLMELERSTFEASLPRGLRFATRSATATLVYALRAPRTAWPAIDTTMTDPRLQPAIAMVKRDTVKLRAAAQALDSIAAMMTAAGASDSGYSVIAADAYLLLRDTTSALRSLRFGLDAAVTTTPYFPQNSGQLPPVYFVPRMMLLRADLAAATGQREEARTWYRRFIDVWATAAPELQPLVQRARKSLESVGTT